MGLAPDETRDASAEASRSAALRTEADHAPRPDGLLLSLHHQRAFIPELEQMACLLVGGGADEDLARLAGALKSGRDVHRVSDGGVVVGAPPDEDAGDDGARVDADLQPKRRCRAPRQDTIVGGPQALPDRDGRVALRPPMQSVAHVERGPYRALLFVLVGDRGAEERHHAVPHELVDEAAPLGDAVAEGVQATGDQRADLLRIQLFGKRGEAGKIGEEDRDDAALSVRRRPDPVSAFGAELGTGGRFGGAARAGDRSGKLPLHVLAPLGRRLRCVSDRLYSGAPGGDS